jgi:MoxR-like ATPase
MQVDIRELQERVERESSFVDALTLGMNQVIVGQKHLVESLLIGLLSDGHILLEGVPGLAKTLAIKTLSDLIKADFSRIQFTPDLLPADVIGTMIYNPKTGDFTTKKGPIFANIVLADEINRAPAKVQSALLEAMQERQVTVGDSTFKLDDPFMVLATQNPVEQEGTYALPEAQVDRFMFKLKVDYPSKVDELKILNRMASITPQTQVEPVLTTDDVKRLRQLADVIYMEEKIGEYIVDLVDATRHPDAYGLGQLAELIRYGASPRATVLMAMAAKGQAMMEGRGYVTPNDVKTVAPDILRHRVIVTYEAEAEEKSSEEIVRTVLNEIKVP